MEEVINTFIIVGGGTAGTMTAALMKALFGKQIDITLIESPKINTIGVGEATLPSLKVYLRALGIDEIDWMVKCNATFKCGLKYINWSGFRPHDSFFHPFFWEHEPMTQMDDQELKSMLTYWGMLTEQEEFDSTKITPDLFLGAKLGQQQKAPKPSGETSYSGYAYHMDASLFADYLLQWAVQRGVKHIIDHVTEVQISEDGSIRSIKTENHGEIVAQFFIDCTGFRGLLIEQTLKEPFITYSDWLFCDRAVAISTPYPETQQELDSITTLTALTAGWMWRIPLFHRLGHGYVYSSSFLTPDEAERELLELLGGHSNDQKAKHLKMRVGRIRNVWVKNCLSIGLSSGFIEPLESTAIALIQMGIGKFLLHFQDRINRPATRDKYNKIIAQTYEELRDFIILHYCLTNREDTPFWRAYKHLSTLPDTLRFRLEAWQDQCDFLRFLPKDASLMFNYLSWCCILLGMSRVPKAAIQQMDPKAIARANNTYSCVKRDVNWQANIHPDHRKYLMDLRKCS